MKWEGKAQGREDQSLACRSKQVVSSSSRMVLPAPAAAVQPSQIHYSNMPTQCLMTSVERLLLGP